MRFKRHCILIRNNFFPSGIDVRHEIPDVVLDLFDLILNETHHLASGMRVTVGVIGEAEV